MFENYPFIAFFHLFYHVLDNTSTTEEIRTMNEVIVGLRDLQSQKSPPARSCSPLPIACALMNIIAKVKAHGDNEHSDLPKDLVGTGGVSSKSFHQGGRL